MSEIKPYKELIQPLVVEKESGKWGWLNELRQVAVRRFEELGFPTKKLEAWKYLPLEPILDARFAQNSDQRSSIIKYSTQPILPEGVIVEDLDKVIRERPEWVRPYLAVGAEKEPNAFVSINTFSFKQGIFIYLPDDVILTEPIHFLIGQSERNGSPQAFCPRILIVAGKRTSFSVIADYVGFENQKFLSNTVAEIYLGDGACLEFLQFQREPSETFQFVANRFFLKEASCLNLRQFVQGGFVTRNENQVQFNGPHGHATLKGLSVLSGQSQVYQHATVRHEVGNCTSRQFYKNILADQAKSEFNSLVTVHRDAQKSDSQQLNRNLLMSDLAQSFSRPQLQINADDVQCTHGATVGQIEKEELFYLRSRGLSEKEARFVLTYGFAHEFVEEIKSPILRAQIEKSVVEEIEKAIQKG